MARNAFREGLGRTPSARCRTGRRSSSSACTCPRGHQPAGVRHAARARLARARPERTFATVDHIVPTLDQVRPFADAMAEDMMAALERNCREHGIPLFDLSSGAQGIVHVIGPGARADAAGHDDRLRRQPHLDARRVRRDRVRHRHVAGARRAGLAVPGDGRRSRCAASASTASCRPGVYAKDVILAIIRRLGVKGGIGYAYEYAGDSDRAHVDGRAHDDLQHVDRGRRARRLRQPGRDDVRVPARAAVRARRARPSSAAARGGRRMASDPDAPYDDEVAIDAAEIAPTVTWGINPGQSVGVDERLPRPATLPAPSAGDREALEFMGFAAGPADRGHADRRRVHRLVHERAAVRSARGGAHRPRPARRAARAGAGRAGLAGGARAAEREGLDQVFRDAGFEWRGAGCSMCLAMNPDRLEGPRGLRVVVEPQLQGPAGKPDRPHAADEPGDGGRRGDRRRGRRRAGVRVAEADGR